MAGEYLDPSRWYTWMNPDTLGPVPQRRAPFAALETDPFDRAAYQVRGDRPMAGPPSQLFPSQSPRGMMDRLRDTGDYIKDRFNNPPDERSAIGMAGSAFRGLTSPMPEYGDSEGMAQKVNDLSALAMPGGFLSAPRGAIGSSGSRPPMNKVAQLNLWKAKQQGYPNEPFFRRNHKDQRPTEFPEGGRFWRNDKAGWKATRRGEEVSEYRLATSKVFDPTSRLTAADMAHIFETVNAIHPEVAAKMTHDLVPGGGIEKFRAFVKDAPELLGPEGWWMERLLLKHKVDPNAILPRAGYDAIDYGTGVQKLTGAGIRSVNAAFNPAMRDSQNIMASIPGAGAVPWPSLTTDPSQE